MAGRIACLHHPAQSRATTPCAFKGPACRTTCFLVSLRRSAVPRWHCLRVSAVAPPIMVNSCTGKMGHATAEAVVRAGLKLVPFSFTGASEGVAVGNIGISGIPVELVGPEKRQMAMDRIKAEYPGLILIDYTLPSVVNENVAFYAQTSVPFVVGTTGGDREKMMAVARESGSYAVIAPQMGKQVVAFQAMMETMADNFPGAFTGYRLSVTESHQSRKADTSGTAKAIVASFRKLGVAEFSESDIRKVRDRHQQMDAMHVPEAHLQGHAFHTYSDGRQFPMRSLQSPDGSVSFQFQHNVCGREIYAEGTVDAALFLAKKVSQGASQRIYDMVDVLREGAMR